MECNTGYAVKPVEPEVIESYVSKLRAIAPDHFKQEGYPTIDDLLAYCTHREWQVRLHNGGFFGTEIAFWITNQTGSREYMRVHHTSFSNLFETFVGATWAAIQIKMTEGVRQELS